VVLKGFGDTYKDKGIFMDTNQKMDRMLCEQALERY